MAKTNKYEIVYTLANPLCVLIEAESREEALAQFNMKMSNNPTLTIRSELCGKIDVKVKKVSKL
jgi:uncharacterized protein with PIN domain